MKAYTDESQSRVLSKFLPHESADMQYYADAVTRDIYPRVLSTSEVPSMKSMYYTPCWSLAALLDVLPLTINFDDENDYKLEIETDDGLWYLSYGNPLEHDKLEIEPREDFVDACVEMITKLHEINKL